MPFWSRFGAEVRLSRLIPFERPFGKGSLGEQKGYFTHYEHLNGAEMAQDQFYLPGVELFVVCELSGSWSWRTVSAF